MEDGLGTLSASNVKIMALSWADILVGYSVFVLMEYLTDVWDISFTKAAAIVNVFMGMASVMPIGIAFLVDTLFGNYWMLLFSSSAYSIGLGFLAMSTPPVLSNATGTCSSYKQECIGHVQKALLYTSLPLIAIGIAGHLVSLKSFLDEQKTDENKEAEKGWSLYAILGFVALIFVPIISAIALPYIKPWSIHFGVPAICTLLATIFFMSGSGSYNRKEPEGSPYTRMFRVITAFISKMHHSLPNDNGELHGFDECNKPRPHASRFRCLDRAAIKSSSSTNRWRLCSVTEVDETRIALRLIPMSTYFILVGLVTSIGNTYFVEQANHMDPKVGKLKVPLPILLMFYEIAKSYATKFYNKMEKCCSNPLKKYVPAFGVALAMFLSVFCCIIAALVERRRINVIKKHDLVDKPEETIPMSMFWLLPQFLLLGTLDGLARRSISCFFRDQIPPSWNPSFEVNGSNSTADPSKEVPNPSKDQSLKSNSSNLRRLVAEEDSNLNDDQSKEEEPNPLKSHMVIFTFGVFGAGNIGGVLSVYIVGHISKLGGREGWFKHELNESRLDNYYWTLAILSSIVLVVYAFVAILHNYRESEADQEDQPEEEANIDYAGICCCCCC